MLSRRMRTCFLARERGEAQSDVLLMNSVIIRYLGAKMKTNNNSSVASRRMSVGRSVAVLCMLSSSSCSALVGGPRLTVRQCCSSLQQLQYRVRDDNQPVNIHVTNNNDIIDVSQHSNSDRSLPMPSSLGIRLTSIFPLKSFVFSSHRQLTDTDKKQFEMDEYIYFIERRYSRINRVDIPVYAMNSNEEQSRILPVGFNIQLMRSILSTRILAPLVAPPPPLQHNLPTRRNDDHLKVLGLSSLASAGLRRRLNCEDGNSDDDCDIITSTSHYESRTGPLGRMRSTLASLDGVARAYVTSLRLITNFFMMTVIPEITTYIPELVTSVVILLLVRPILRCGMK
jgi:hypothetical protein